MPPEVFPGNPHGDDHASASVSVAGAFIGIADGFVSVALLASVYTLTLSSDHAIDPNDATILLVSRTGSGIQGTVFQPDDTTIVVSMFNVAAIGDSGFYIKVIRRGVG